ncbi:MAG: phosphate ABC transporter permease subunit PstC [Phycisphaerales bacterium]
MGSLTKPRVRWGERAVEGLLLLAAVSSVAITVGIVGVLVYESGSFFRHVRIGEFLTGREWTPLFADAKFGIAPLVAGTLVTTVIALLFAVPVGTVVSVWLSEYAPRRVREWVKPALELLSAVPTVVYGYFALLLVIPALQWVALRVFSYDLPGSNMLGAGLVMGIMIVPYVASLSEDAMRSVPQNLREGAYAMGATRVQTAWKVVFPASISGVTAAYILAISRALGETMVVAIAAGNRPTLTANPLEPAQTITAFIVQVSLGDLPHDSIGYQSIFAAGLTLMCLTLLFNIGGFYLRRRFREAY